MLENTWKRDDSARGSRGRYAIDISRKLVGQTKHSGRKVKFQSKV